jgi:Uma2 family endonuclease
MDMATLETSSTIGTLADLVDRLGGIPLVRIRYHPLPGTATVEDVVCIEAREGRLCELVDGVLVEKAMGFRESLLAMAIGQWLRDFVAPANLGLVTGSDGMMQLFAGLVRIPDVAFISWANVPGGRVPDHPVPLLAPDLAVEVLSRTNTPGEMRLKRSEYFAAGTGLVWIVDPDRRVVSAYTSPDESHEYAEDEQLDGGQVLPGLSISLRELFSELDRRAN